MLGIIQSLDTIGTHKIMTWHVPRLRCGRCSCGIRLAFWFSATKNKNKQVVEILHCIGIFCAEYFCSDFAGTFRHCVMMQKTYYATAWKRESNTSFEKQTKNRSMCGSNEKKGVLQKPLQFLTGCSSLWADNGGPGFVRDGTTLFNALLTGNTSNSFTLIF